jgi:acetyl esterase/lipase
MHGGFWRERWERDTIEPLAIDLVRRGFATWNLEYRRVGPYGGGWPATCQDVADGIGKLTELATDHPLDLQRVVFIGHSAGGHLALWAVKQNGVSGTPPVRPILVVSLAGVADLEEGARRGLGDTGNGTADLMGGSAEERPDAYAAASPIRALPLGVPQLVVQGRLDNIPDLVDLSRIYVAAARDAGDPVEFIELDDADHFHLIVPTSHAWPPILERIEQAVAAPGATR